VQKAMILAFGFVERILILCSCNLCECDADRHDRSQSESTSTDMARPSEDHVDIDDALADKDDADPTANAVRPLASGNDVQESAIRDDLHAWDPGQDGSVRPTLNVPPGVVIAWENTTEGDVGGVSPAMPAPGPSPAIISGTSAIVNEPGSEHRQASQSALLESRLHLGQLRASFAAQSDDGAQRLDRLVGLDL
jgi:hypothetical protein